MTGTYSAANGATGTINATVTGSSFTFQLQTSTTGCTGTFSGTGALGTNAMTFSYAGSDCIGPHTNGQGTLTSADSTPPALMLTSPIGGEVLTQTQSIEWQTTDAHPHRVEVRLSSDGGASFPVLLASAARDTGTFAFDTRAFPDGSLYRVRLVPTDGVGHMGNAVSSSANFAITNP